MDIIFYKTESANNVVNKVITDELILSGQCVGELNVLNPIIRIVSNVMFKYNYCYIPEYKRYYYISNSNMLRNNLINLYLTVDVLMSYKNEIFDMYAVLERQQSDEYSNPYFDNGYSVDSRTIIEKLNFDSAFNDGEYILITIKSSGVAN